MPDWVSTAHGDGGLVIRDGHGHPNALVCERIAGNTYVSVDAAVDGTPTRFPVNVLREDLDALAAWALARGKPVEVEPLAPGANYDIVETIMTAPITEAIGAAIGRASTCWSEYQAGVFDSTTAVRLVDALEARIRVEINAARHPAPP